MDLFTILNLRKNLTKNETKNHKLIPQIDFKKYNLKREHI